MNIGIIMPDRGDRPAFRNHAEILIASQTAYKEHSIFFRIVQWPAESGECDITKRYKYGYNLLFNKRQNIDVIFLMESDDWYSPHYIDIMLREWIKAGKSDLFGLNHTVYYHIGLNKHFTMHHRTRSSTMNTMIKPDLNFPWCVDNEPYIDIHLWECLEIKNKVIIDMPHEICLGIKHGVGKTGGSMHTTDLHRYVNDDSDMSYLKSIVDEDSFKFYSNFPKIKNPV